MGSSAGDISGYVFKDDDDNHSYPLPAGTTIPAGGHLAIDVTAFGLGKGDSARLFMPDGATLARLHDLAGGDPRRRRGALRGRHRHLRAR